MTEEKSNNKILNYGKNAGVIISALLGLFTLYKVSVTDQINIGRSSDKEDVKTAIEYMEKAIQLMQEADKKNETEHVRLERKIDENYYANNARMNKFVEHDWRVEWYLLQKFDDAKNFIKPPEMNTRGAYIQPIMFQDPMKPWLELLSTPNITSAIYDNLEIDSTHQDQ